MANQTLEQTRDSVLRYGEVVGRELLNLVVRRFQRASVALLDPFLRPLVEPEPPYAPAADVLLFAPVEGEHAVAEVYVRPSGTIGLRCTAWVAWRDAGHVVRGHSWWQSEPPESGIAESSETAREMAEGFAQSRGIRLGQWRSPPNQSLDQTADRIQR